MLFLLLLSLVSAKTFPLSDQVFAARQLAPALHSSSIPMANYVEFLVPADPVHDLADLIDPELTKRPVTHITVITPPEYANVLSPYLNMTQINDIATRMNIQKSSFEIICVGRAVKILPRPPGHPTPDTPDVVHFLVAHSKDLLEIRQAIFEEYVQNGGEPALFDPKTFYPHITLNWTYRDMFFEDGIYKNENTCWADVSINKNRSK